jgi:DNA-binding response OmpR family regulator
MRVLVVDDDPEVLAIIEELLSFLGYDVTGSGSADRARVRLAAKDYDVLLIDAPMHRLGGIDLAKEVRASGTPVLMIPAGADLIAPLEAAGLPFVVKPFYADDLTRAIDSITSAQRAKPGSPFG